MSRVVLLVAVLLGALPLVSGCGRGQDPAVEAGGTASSTGAGASTPSTGAAPAAPLSLGVAPLEGLVAGAPVEWVLTVTAAPGADRTISFPSGQQGEVVLLDADGAEALRWSAGMLFAQALTELVVPGGAEVAIVLPGTLDVAPGDYTLVASVPGAPAPAPVEQVVTVGG